MTKFVEGKDCEKSWTSDRIRRMVRCGSVQEKTLVQSNRNMLSVPTRPLWSSLHPDSAECNCPSTLSTLCLQALLFLHDAASLYTPNPALRPNANRTIKTALSPQGSPSYEFASSTFE